MSDESVAEPEVSPEPEVKAGIAWIGRQVVVTYENSVWYEGVVTRVTEGGEYVEVEDETIKGWLWKRTVKEATWHAVEDVYLIHK